MSINGHDDDDGWGHLEKEAWLIRQQQARITDNASDVLLLLVVGLFRLQFVDSVLDHLVEVVVLQASPKHVHMVNGIPIL